ncbi:MAG TPA: metallophosphoesterase [Thermoleophilaceae bacterium]|nr:metallophosphoesterase [Thermoleophilaceae bacterium]
MAVAVLTIGWHPAAAPAQVENGAIAFSAKRAGDRALFTRASNGSQLRVIPTGGRADHVEFSPAGRRVAFTKYGPLGAQVWVSYLDGTGIRQLTTGPADTMADWSPTGADLVFARGTNGSRDLYRIRADGVGLRRLTASARNDDSPSWSIQDQVAFVRAGATDDDIYVIGAGGGPARRLTRSRQDDASPAWSPTGGTLVFSRGRPGRRDLYVIRGDGGRVRRLTEVPGDESEPAFSPDGSRIVFTHRDGRSQRLYVMKVRGDAVRRLPRRSARVRKITSGRSAARQAGWQPTGLDPVVAAAGDIACDPTSPNFNGGEGFPGVCRQRLTSDLLLRTDLAGILVPGDLQYETGKLEAFAQSFHPTWGRLRPLIRPVPGNHEYGDPGAAGYFDYFNGPGVQSGPAGNRGQGFYSFDVGSWHVIALNSECEQVGGCSPNSPQARWLRADLAAHPVACTLAFFHGPRFTSGRYGEQSEQVRPFWDALYAAGADLVLSGHEHFYERFGPQTPDGVADPARGLRQLTVGMGGKSRHGFITVAANSEVRDNRTMGVLELTLREGTYDWKLVGAPNGNVADAGTGACH